MSQVQFGAGPGVATSQLGVGSLDSSEKLEGGHFAGEEIVAGVTIRPQLSCYTGQTEAVNSQLDNTGS